MAWSSVTGKHIPPHTNMLGYVLAYEIHSHNIPPVQFWATKVVAKLYPHIISL